MSVVPMIAHLRAAGVLQADPDPQLQPTLGLDEMPVDHWNLLFRAVETRLGQAMTDFSINGPGPTARTTVLECLEALNQLHSILGNERGRTERLERELREARAALTQLSAEPI